MRHINPLDAPDVILIYQERDEVELAIEQIMSLELKFKAFKYSPAKLHKISSMKPKVLLLSSNSIKNTIRLYIDYLEEYESHISAHSAILLISNKETACAYLACENGLFDNYAIINPLNEPFRLKLALLQELKIIESHKSNSLEELITEGEDELASCIEHGLILKKTFIEEVEQCEKSLLTAVEHTNKNHDSQAILQELVCDTVKGMNINITEAIDNIAVQLNQLKANHGSIKEHVEGNYLSKKKTTLGVNTDVLIGETKKGAPAPTTSSYKLLIAEPSDLFSRVIDEMFAETVFKYKLVSDGIEALEQINNFKPDVVLLAYDLPSLDGISLTKKMRVQGNKIPVIAYVHNRDKAVIRRWISLGISDFLIKPSKKSTILKTVAKAVKNPTNVIENQNILNSENFQWQPEFSIGNQQIDEQHQMLFTMINDFFHQDGQDAAIDVFNNLSFYIDLHFEDEENLLKQLNYPDTQEHIQKHNDLKSKFQVIQKKLQHYDLEVHFRISMFLYNWLAQHILKEDMAYKNYALSINECSFNND